MHHRQVLQGCHRPGVTERFPQLPDAVLEHRVGDEGRGPYGFEELLLGDELTAMLDTVLQHSERLRPEADLGHSVPQGLIRRVQPEFGEARLFDAHYDNITAT